MFGLVYAIASLIIPSATVLGIVIANHKGAFN